MRRSSPRKSARATSVLQLGNFSQLLRDAEYGRLLKVLQVLQSMEDRELAAMNGSLLVRGIERVTAAKMPTLLEIIDYCARHGMDPNSSSVFAATTTFPLVRAAYHGFDAVVEKLIEHGADVNVVAGTSACTLDSALSAAVRSDKLRVLELLLQHNASAGLRLQALWQSYQSNNVGACNLLLAYGTKLDDTFAAMLSVLDQVPRFMRFAQQTDALAHLVTRQAPPWNVR